MLKKIIVTMAYILFYFVIQLIVGGLFTLYGMSKGITGVDELEQFSNHTILLIVLIANVIAVALIAFIRRNKGKSLASMMKLKTWNVKTLFLSMTFAFSVSLIFFIMTSNIQFDNASQIELSVAYFSNIKPGLGEGLMILSLLISAPFTEEYLYRGVIFDELVQKFSPMVTVVLCALLFGVAHIVAGGLILTLGASLMGLIFGLIYIKTKSLFTAMIAHSAANLPDFIFMFLSKPKPFLGIGIIVISAMTALICYFLLSKMTRIMDSNDM